MHFFTLFAAALATVATVAIAAPSPCGNCTGPMKPDPVDPKPVDPKLVDPRPENTTVPVGSTSDLNPDTPLCSLSCAATFAKKFPSESPRFHVQRDDLLISSFNLQSSTSSDNCPPRPSTARSPVLVRLTHPLTYEYVQS